MSQFTSTTDPAHQHRYACIDCGTNSIKVIVADLGAAYAQSVFQLSETTRIGEGMQAHGMLLQPEPMRRTLDAIERFAQAAVSQGAQATALVGTAALRDARNRDEFVCQARQRSGLDLEVISGDEEARLSFLAVRHDPHWRTKTQLLVIDIGGGSTELIQGEVGTDRVASRISVNLGAVKLTESCLRSDPPSATELDAANGMAKKAFASVEVTRQTGQPYHVVGVGGTLTNLGAMKRAAAIDSEQLHGLSLSTGEISAFRDTLATHSVEMRRGLPGLEPSRADIILAGAILLMHALAHIHCDRVEISTRGLRWGVLYDRFLSNSSATMEAV